MDERVTALSQHVQLRICTSFIDNALGIPREIFCIVQMCIAYCRSQYDNRNPRLARQNMMRRILMDRARAKNMSKRGRGAVQVNSMTLRRSGLTRETGRWLWHARCFVPVRS